MVHEYHLAQKLLQTDHPEAILKRFPLYQRYVRLVTTHVERMGLFPGSRMAFIGCGPVPMSQILLNISYGISSIGFHTDTNVVKLANGCIAHLVKSEQITILHGNETLLWEEELDAVVVAALAEPQKLIFETLRKICSQRGPVPLAFRTYIGLRAFLYYPFQPEDIVGFNEWRKVMKPGETIILSDGFWKSYTLLKLMHDHYQEIKLVVSGSSSFDIKKKFK
ncbi:MAG: nicotianamine synthase family protein, partial [bacterium]